MDNASANDLVSTKPLVKNGIMLTDGTPPHALQMVAGVPPCTAPGPQEGSLADSGGGRDFKQKTIKEN